MVWKAAKSVGIEHAINVKYSYIDKKKGFDPQGYVKRIIFIFFEAPLCRLVFFVMIIPFFMSKVIYSDYGSNDGNY